MKKLTRKEEILNREEIELYGIKFFDYRAVSPDVATMMFMYEYGRAMETYNDTLGYTKYRHILKAFDKMELEALKKQGQFKQLASLRRWADKHGMPYKLFWSYATEAHLNLGFAKTYINIFAHKSIKDNVLEMWTDWKKHTVVRSESPIFKAENFQGYDLQKQYYDYVIKETCNMLPEKEAGEKILELVKAKELDAAYTISAIKKIRGAA